MTSAQPGAGATTIAAFLADHLAREGQPVVLVEADPQEDAMELLASAVDRSFRMDLSVKKGWTRLIKVVSDFPGHAIIVNCPGCLADAVMTFAPALIRASVRLERYVVTICATGSGVKGARRLRDMEGALRGSRFHVMLAGAWCNASDLRRLRKTKMAEQIRKGYGDVHLVPRVSGRVARYLYRGVKLPYGVGAFRRRGAWKRTFNKIEASLKPLQKE